MEISSLSHPSADEGVQAIVNQLFIGTVTREYLGTKLQCRAQGSKLVGAVVKEVTVQVHCKYPPSSESFSFTEDGIHVLVKLPFLPSSCLITILLV